MERRVIVRGRLRAARSAGRTLKVRGPVDGTDPFATLLDAWFDPAMPAARWSVVFGVDLDVEAALDVATARRELLIVRSGSEDADALLADLSPVLGRLLDDLTSSQRRLARLLLIEGLRQADAAETLGISRASVSVAKDAPGSTRSTSSFGRCAPAGRLVEPLRRQAIPQAKDDDDPQTGVVGCRHDQAGRPGARDRWRSGRGGARRTLARAAAARACSRASRARHLESRRRPRHRQRWYRDPRARWDRARRWPPPGCCCGAAWP